MSFEAFIDLDLLQLHPDKPGLADNHERFVKINEAYSILSKPESKKVYDLGLSGPADEPTASSHPGRRSVRYEQRDFAGRARGFGFRPQDPKYVHVNSYLIAFGCILFAVFGYVVHYQIALLSFQSHRDFLDKRTDRLNREIDEIKANHDKFANRKEQMDYIRQRLVADREKINNK